MIGYLALISRLNVFVRLRRIYRLLQSGFKGLIGFTGVSSPFWVLHPKPETRPGHHKAQPLPSIPTRLQHLGLGV